MRYNIGDIVLVNYKPSTIKSNSSFYTARDFDITDEKSETKTKVKIIGFDIPLNVCCLLVINNTNITSISCKSVYLKRFNLDQDWIGKPIWWTSEENIFPIKQCQKCTLTFRRS